MKENTRKEGRRIRHVRLRKRIFGTADRPRMAISISSRNMNVQFIDDDKGCTMAAAAARGADEGHNMATGTALGTRAAEAAAKAGIRRAVVDRGGHKFHGRVKAVVDAAVEAGLVIRANKET